MKAFQFVEWQRPGELRDVPVPEPGPGQVLVKVGGAGAATPICTSWSYPPTRGRFGFPSPSAMKTPGG